MSARTAARRVLGVAAVLAALILAPAATAARADGGAPFPPGALVAPLPDRGETGAVSEREYILSIIAERDRQYAQRFQSQETAVAAALTAQKEAVAAALAAQEKATAAALISAKEAVDKAADANAKHFDSVNEFRKTLSDQTATFIPRAEASIAAKAQDDKLKGLTDRLDAIATLQTQAAGKSEGINSFWLVLVILTQIGIAAATLIWKGKSR
jgi:hypothetical protein